MKQCPNCGSTTHLKVESFSNPPRTAIIERIICGCGCVTTTTYKLARERKTQNDKTR